MCDFNELKFQRLIDLANGKILANTPHTTHHTTRPTTTTWNMDIMDCIAAAAKQCSWNRKHIYI
jgi:hypothetical protein